MCDQHPVSYSDSDGSTSISRQRRESMLPELLSEVRSVRRSRTAFRVASVAGVVALVSGVFILAFQRDQRSTMPERQFAGGAIVSDSISLQFGTPRNSTRTIVELVLTDPDVLNRLSFHAARPVTVEYINTAYAMALLQSERNGVGAIEVNGRVEFTFLAGN